MEYKTLNLPIEYDETMDILDSSKVSCFQDCPRKFLFKYLFGWQPIAPNIHLVFGSAWHEAMQVLMDTFKDNDGSKRGYTREEVAAAYRAFCELYSMTYGDAPLDGLASLSGLPAPDMKAKDAENALMALVDYSASYSDDNFRTLFTEIAGTVPISPDRIIHTKLDSIVFENGLWSYEHKTTSRRTDSWLAQWSLVLQIGTYSHFLYSWAQLMGEEFKGIRVNGAILRAPTKSTGRSNNDFVRIPVQKTKAMMAQWLWEINNWYDLLDWNMKQLEKARKEDDVLRCFPRNPTSCTKFGCAYPGLCELVPNPLSIYERMPSTYKKEFWNPRRDEDAKYRVDLADGDGDVKEVKHEEVKP